MLSFAKTLDEYKSNIQDVLDSEVENMEALKDSCGPFNSIDAFFDALGGLFVVMDRLYVSIVVVASQVRCTTVYPLYKYIVHYCLCGLWADLVARCTIILFVITLSNMCVITVRTALQT